jgi:hypothetical protein
MPRIIVLAPVAIVRERLGLAWHLLFLPMAASGHGILA